MGTKTYLITPRDYAAYKSCNICELVTQCVLGVFELLARDVALAEEHILPTDCIMFARDGKLFFTNKYYR